jgi:hypothetical protein
MSTVAAASMPKAPQGSSESTGLPMNLKRKRWKLRQMTWGTSCPGWHQMPTRTW